MDDGTMLPAFLLFLYLIIYLLHSSGANERLVYERGWQMAVSYSDAEKGRSNCGSSLTGNYVLLYMQSMNRI